MAMVMEFFEIHRQLHITQVLAVIDFRYCRCRNIKGKPQISGRSPSPGLCRLFPLGVDLRVAAVKSTWPLQVKSSRFSSKSPPKFTTQVAAEFFDKSHDL